jgi:hypothetical protein
MSKIIDIIAQITKKIEPSICFSAKADYRNYLGRSW